MKTLTIQLPEKLYELLVSYSRKRGKDVTDALKEYAQIMVWEEKKEEAISAYNEEKVTLRELADLLGLSYWEADELLEKEGIALIR
ncbi:MAG: UPF0175 family protein [Deltaproteobacteria bacterium]|nr:UPF0175 family protein [Deltaproteobacteria bacterium]